MELNRSRRSSRRSRSSLYRSVLNRQGRAMDQMDRMIQKLIFQINRYCKLKFEDEAIPSVIISFREELELLNPTPQKLYDFSYCNDLDEEDIIAEMESTHMWLYRKGNEQFKNAVVGFDKLFPYIQSSDYSHPTTPTSSLSPLSSLTAESNENDDNNGNGNGRSDNRSN